MYKCTEGDMCPVERLGQIQKDLITLTDTVKQNCSRHYQRDQIKDNEVPIGAPMEEQSVWPQRSNSQVNITHYRCASGKHCNGICRLLSAAV